MADHHHHHHCSNNQQLQNLPKIIVLLPPGGFKFLESEYSHKFHFLKAWESQLSMDQFLSTRASSVQAMLSSANGPLITAQILQMLPSLRVIVTTSAGLDHVDLLECRRRGIAVANAGNVFSEDVADMAVGLLIDVLRKMSAADRYVRCGIWARNGDYHLGSKLRGKRVGIVGLGSIGLEVAKRLEAFGCSILYNSRKEKPNVSYPFYSNIHELAANSDVLVICCALNEQTHHIVNREVMLALGKEGVIVNVARGAIVDEKEMVKCLLHGEIGGAGLDVYEHEPHVPKELLTMDNVVLSPHGAVSTLGSVMALRELVAANFEAFFSNRPLLSLVVND
ncbi:glyoxylate/hydroxypyruvate reductase HPR3-like [Ziziphus jujuba]|uniref:glyoxylate reductase (NADP(+)) n=1 Tax=Ziziphus jujuba TaxID=326968 RepID=A0A6P4ARP2_ZIZJJ|nr:glyoxylate/hydroxypyruvate reductase HPR3-like [Ziziphus jujuba]